MNGFHRWMLGLSAQWMQLNPDNNRANSVAPLLVSSRQGLGKSTFCRLLMPDRLKSYYTESYDLSSPASAEAKLAAYGLINLDEFDKLGASKMPLLKNLMQASALNIRKAYKHSASIASPYCLVHRHQQPGGFAGRPHRLTPLSLRQSEACHRLHHVRRA